MEGQVLALLDAQCWHSHEHKTLLLFVKSTPPACGLVYIIKWGSDFGQVFGADQLAALQRLPFQAKTRYTA